MRLNALITMVADEYRGSARASPRLISGLIGVVLSQIGNVGGHQAVEEMAPTRALAVALRRAIDRHYREDWQVARYVELLATTPHLLDKAARETFGQSVKDILMERRLLEAKRLLRFTIRSHRRYRPGNRFRRPRLFLSFLPQAHRLLPGAMAPR